MNKNPATTTVKTPSANFTGDVWMNPVFGGDGTSALTVALVRFTPGARTNWHRHINGQLLVCTDGVGLVGTRDGEVVRVRAGDTVVAPPGEEHWHGAAGDTFMSHLGMLEAGPDGGDPTTWLEPVTDEEYRAADGQ